MLSYTLPPLWAVQACGNGLCFRWVKPCCGILAALLHQAMFPGLMPLLASIQHPSELPLKLHADLKILPKHGCHVFAKAVWSRRMLLMALCDMHLGGLGSEGNLRVYYSPVSACVYMNYTGGTLYVPYKARMRLCVCVCPAGNVSITTLPALSEKRSCCSRTQTCSVSS